MCEYLLENNVNDNNTQAIKDVLDDMSEEDEITIVIRRGPQKGSGCNGTAKGVRL